MLANRRIRQSLISLVFSISQEYNYICLHFLMQYMHCHSLEVPAKYHDNRLDVLNVGSIFP